MYTPTDDMTALAWFKERPYRNRLRSCLLAPVLDDLVLWLSARGYTANSIYQTLRQSLRLAEFATADGVVDLRAFSDDLLDRFVAAWGHRPRAQRSARVCARRVLCFLRERRLAPPGEATPTEPPSPLLREYLHYLTQHRGVSLRHAKRHGVHVAELLVVLEAAVDELDARHVFTFVTQRAPGLSRSGRKSMCAALRSFLRFAHVGGYIKRDLASAVPVIPSFKLARLPQPISREAIDKILAAVDRTTRVGRRDYALLQMLATYGIRAGQICALRLDDIDWRHESIRIRGVKEGYDNVLPLLRPVGDALIEYLRMDRPSRPFREVFLRVRAPIGPLMGNLTNVIKPYARKAGLTDVPMGPHAWRHACATRMLSDGQSLKTIREVLGHRSIETTFIYTKVDVEMLRHAALEWPELKP